VPYVSPEKRERLDADPFGSQTAGELGYVLGKLANTYLRRNGEEWRFQDLCDVIGAFESIKLETYRNVGAPYENLQIELAGDVYDTRPGTLASRDIAEARAYHRKRLAQREGRA
jgi:hypothetical protein